MNFYDILLGRQLCCDKTEYETLVVTENGEYSAPQGKAWSKVVVETSGGDSDFTVANVTIRATSFPDYDPSTATTLIPVIYNDRYDLINGLAVPVTVQIPLYKGSAIFIESDFIVNKAVYESTYDISGAITFDSETGFFTVMGDCEIGVGLGK